MKQYAEAIPYFEGTLEFYRKAAKENSKYQESYFVSLYWLSKLYGETEKHKEIYNVNQELLPLLKTKYKENDKIWKYEYVSMLGNQSFFAIFMKQYAEAEQYARKGLAVDSTQLFIYTNLAAALLFQGKYGEAEVIYRQYKDELKDGFLGDLKQFAEAGVIPKEREEDVEKIKKLLEE